MLIRNKFITNSSSTSFIAWGFIVPADRRPHNDDFVDDFYDTAPFSVGTALDDDRQPLIYTWKSRVDTEETDTGSRYIEDMNIPDILPDILAFAEKVGIDLKDLKPGWFYTRYSS